MKNDLNLAKELRDIIGRAKDYSRIQDAHEIFMDAEAIIGTLAFLISPLLDLEQEYRKLIITYIEEGDSNAKAEAKAKVSEVYKNWQKIKAIYELGNEQIMLLKKFKDDLQGEMKRSKI